MEKDILLSTSRSPTEESCLVIDLFYSLSVVFLFGRFFGWDRYIWFLIYTRQIMQFPTTMTYELLRTPASSPHAPALCAGCPFVSLSDTTECGTGTSLAKRLAPKPIPRCLFPPLRLRPRQGQ
ncbi:hypothetical protein LY76DRAFT_588026 [Colletotrichum caudatum]|nr:hypothetical protein LY76DRAFT_588026 [Colletotrichum caudatum]